jgi:CubicO group peptidase (beta-lactamase class C family)
MRLVKVILASALAALTLPLAAQQNLPLTPPVSTDRSPADPARPTVPVTTPDTRPAGGVPLEANDLNAFLDGLVPQAIAGGDIAGGVVVVVKDGQILTQRGYGFADVKARKPVDPQRTLFRPGSVSKLFTWTAVMQQVERGKLDLDADVNRYLDFKIPDRDGKPITLRNIMKHTAGFEEQAKGIIAFKPENVDSFEALLKQWVPERVFAPGTTPAYSNYATSLAGYIVQRVSGEPFDDYLDRHIFQPLGMANSTFRQPLPPRLQPMMAQGYKVGSGEPVGFEYVGPAPAGSLSATGEDMARFMIAHLQGGRAILQPQTAQLMHRGATTRTIPALNGIELGFYESDINGREVISHGGDTVAFHSTLHLFPGERVGIFASFNSSGRNGAVGDLRSALFQRFADRYFPGPRDTRRVDSETAKQHAQLMTGAYASSRGSRSSFLHLSGLLGQVKIGVGKDGQLVLPIANGFNGQPRRWVETQPFVWTDLDSDERLAAVVEDGKVSRFSISSIAPIMVFDRVPWYKSSSLLMPLLVASFVALLLTALVWPAAALVRRRYGAKLALEGNELRVYRLSKIASIAILLTLLGWVLVISVMLGDIKNLNATMDPVLWILQVLSLIAFIGGLALMVLNLWTVWRGKRRWPAKVWSVVLVLAALVVLWLALAFNLMAMTVNY